MDPGRAAPPAAERCLVLRYASSGQKGGTLIDESVVDLADHEARMHDPGSYRPKECRCGGWGLENFWAVVERVVAGTRRADEPRVPERTQRRWLARLAQTARVPGQVLATSGSATLREVAQGVGLDADRRGLAARYAERFHTSLLAPLEIGRA